MAIFYPFPSQIPVWQVIGASLLILIITTAVIVMIKRLPYLFVGWMWYAITIAPVIGIIQISAYAMADHYHYLPSVGIAVMLAWGIPSLIKSEEIRKKILCPAGMIFLGIMAFLTWQQCGYWKNSITLFSHALQVTKDNYLAHNNLGLALLAEGKSVEAINHFNKAIRITPDCAGFYSNRGIAYTNLGQYKLAIEDYNKSIRITPDYADAYNNRGIAYFRLGKYQMAIEDYNEAIRMQPNDARAYNNRATVYFLQGNNKLGCPDAQKACELGICNVLEMAKGKGLCR
jgi:tetratricopeptide (TPR) repeat protein